MDLFIEACAFVFGAIVGSFLNVCIYRIPARVSLLFPGSRCPVCEAPIRWYQNIPILSWLVLGGKCAECRTAISVRYPVIEALTGCLYLSTVYYFGLSAATGVYLLLLSALLVVSFIDLDHQVVPNVISLPGMFIGFVLAGIFLPTGWVDSLLGVLLGGGLLLAVATGYRLLTGVDGMGMGDVKLLAMIGAFLGWQSILPTLFLGSLAGTLVGIPLMLYRRAGSRLAIPFGPFLSLGAVLYLFVWPQLFSWYVSTFLAFP